AVERLTGPDDLEQRGLAGAVAADQANPLAGADRERGTVEQRVEPVGELRIDEGQQRHGGARIAQNPDAGPGCVYSAPRVETLLVFVPGRPRRSGAFQGLEFANPKSVPDPRGSAATRMWSSALRPGIAVAELRQPFVPRPGRA